MNKIKEVWKNTSKGKKTLYVVVALFIISGLGNAMGNNDSKSLEEIKTEDQTEKQDTINKENNEEDIKYEESDDSSKENNINYQSLKNDINSITYLSGANQTEIDIFNTRKSEIIFLIDNKASLSDIESSKAMLLQTNTDIQTRLDNEAAARAVEEETRQEQKQQESYRDPNMLCEDGTYAPNGSNPSDVGRANQCYGHGGFVINH